MPLPTVSLPDVWDLPVMAGVPVVLGAITGSPLAATGSALLGGAIESYLTTAAASQWGIFSSAGESVLSAARVYGVEYELGYQISDAPVEDGQFVSYNKVRVPYTARILMVCDGSEAGLAGLLPGFRAVLGNITGAGPLKVRQTFFDTLESIVTDTNLYTIVTPEQTYRHANVVGYRFRRDAEGGITMPVAEIAIQEVRVTATSATTNTRTPEGQTVVQTGVVQPQSAPAGTPAPKSDAFYQKQALDKIFGVS